MRPTDELYQSLLEAYEHFNKTLFDGRLPEVIFTVQRQKGVLGYFAPDRWSSMEGRRCHEIAINPAHLGQSRVIDVLQTLVHEMAHCWQHCFGSPGRGSYHNREWADKMIDIGLQPTSTGLPGGNVVGQQMSDYPITGGPFLLTCETLISTRSYNIPWIDRRSVPKSVRHENSAHTTAEVIGGQEHFEEAAHEVPAPAGQDTDGLSIAELMRMTYAELLPEESFVPVPPKARPKNKYQCPECANRVWGKPDMHIICGDCNAAFEPV